MRQIKEVLTQVRILYKALNTELQDPNRRSPANAHSSASNVGGPNSATTTDRVTEEGKLDGKGMADDHNTVGDSDGFGFAVGMVV